MKKNGFVNEFKAFINRGNVMDMAVGVIIGGAFSTIVNSLVNDIIMPVVSQITGGINYSEMFIALNGQTYASLEEAKKVSASTLNYGSFITAVINFLILAFVIFLLVKFLNMITGKEKAQAAAAASAASATPTTKKCEFCKTDIAYEATRCPNCTSQLTK